MSSSSAGMGSTLTAFFDQRSDAESAFERLQAAGIDPASIRLTEGTQGGGSAQSSKKGFFESLSDLFVPDQDRHSYAEGLSRGGTMIAVSNVPASLSETALDILDDEGAVDLDSREEAWRSEGWTDYSAGAYGSPNDRGSTTETERGFAEDRAQFRGEGEEDVTGEEKLPVVEERLRVGKREVGHGRVRVRSYVVEEPVSTDVNLREESVSIERRSVDRPLETTDRAFENRTVEAEAHGEEAVVSKEARVVEEVGLRKERDVHTETVQDTVRKQDVEIEDDRAATDRDPRRT